MVWKHPTWYSRDFSSISTMNWSTSKSMQSIIGMARSKRFKIHALFWIDQCLASKACTCFRRPGLIIMLCILKPSYRASTMIGRWTKQPIRLTVSSESLYGRWTSSVEWYHTKKKRALGFISCALFCLRILCSVVTLATLGRPKNLSDTFYLNCVHILFYLFNTHGKLLGQVRIVRFLSLNITLAGLCDINYKYTLTFSLLELVGSHFQFLKFDTLSTLLRQFWLQLKQTTPRAFLVRRYWRWYPEGQEEKRAVHVHHKWWGTWGDPGGTTWDSAAIEKETSKASPAGSSADSPVGSPASPPTGSPAGSPHPAEDL